VQRTQALGIDVKEAFMVMAGAFFTSSEYLARQRNNTDYITDLYNTFFNRAPDSGGLAYWSGMLAGTTALSRGVVMNSFMFSPEFAAYMANLPGNAVSRPEVYASVDFYRGVLGRLPDNGGFDYWLNKFQTAQCGGAGPVYNSIDAMSSGFAASPEYTARSRSDADYVSDLYYAFLRRGADQTGFAYWVSQLTSKVQSRDQLRKAFISSPEFTARVNAIIAAGCVPSPVPCTLTATPIDLPAACGTTPTPVDGSCDVALTLSCMGGAATSYGWSVSPGNQTLAPSTAPPVNSQKLTITTSSSVTAAASNAAGTGTASVYVTVGGSGGGGGSGGVGGGGVGGGGPSSP